MGSQVKINALNLRPEDIIVRLFKFRRDNPNADFEGFNLISTTNPALKLVCKDLFNNPLYWEGERVTSEGFKQFRKMYRGWRIDGFGKPEVTYRDFINMLKTKKLIMRSQVKTINEDVLYAELPEGGFSVQDYVQLFNDSNQMMTTWRGTMWIRSFVPEDHYQVNAGDLLVREGNTVSKWDKEAFEEEFNTEI